jgi:uncharacterized membrane protein YdjX (TVP38/TMEM64 family)
VGKDPDSHGCQGGLASEGERRRHRLRLLIIAGLALLFISLVSWQPVAVADVISWGKSLAPHPAAMPVLILLQALLLALALPGTLMLWVVAPFYDPLTAALILIAGSALGALSAYYTSRWLGGLWQPGPTGQRVLDLLARQGDVWTQLALRVLPGFPHSVINYGAGTLGLPLGPFLMATVIGLALKWPIYTYAVHALVTSGMEDAALEWITLLPLLVLAALLVGGRALRARLG